MKILYSGGGTMGSVSPLIAIQQQLTINNQQSTIKNVDSLWLGTKNGPERNVVEKEGIKFQAIASGKLRRYFDVQNLIDILNIIIGFFQSLYYILKFQPDMILSAGSFVAVPVVWAGWLCSVPIIIHQQDMQVGLANKLMAPFATKITVALKKNLQDFDKKKVVLAGNPLRAINNQQLTINNDFTFNNHLPVLLVMGGGTGAQAINELIWQSLNKLTKFCNLIHLTGKNKNTRTQEHKNIENYKSFEFLSQAELFPLIQNSDLVISRAGMSALTELAYFSKPTIIIPIPQSHQEKNAQYFADKQAGIYLKQKKLNSEKLVKQIKQILENEKLRKDLGENMHKIFISYSADKIIEIIKSITK